MNGNERKIQEIVAVKKEGAAAPLTARRNEQEKNERETTPPLNPAQPQEISWEAPEFEFFHKTTRWYVFSAVVALACIALGIFQRNILFIVLTVITYITVVGWSQKAPRHIRYRLTEDGIYAHDSFYPYNTLAWFSTEGEGSAKELIVARKAKISSRLRIILSPATSSEMIRAHLIKKIRENKDFEENFFDLLAKRIGF